MALKIIRWSVLTLSLLCLLISIANSQIVKKIVSVKTPERFSNVHKHFTSATHNYDAQHSVNIDRTQIIPSILKQFNVAAPFIFGSRQEHFDLAVPEYEGTGEVLLHPESPLLTHEIFDTHQNPESYELQPPQLFTINTLKNANPFLIHAFPILPEDFFNSNGIEEGDPLVESPSQRVVKKTHYSPYKISRTKTTVPGVHLRKSISVKSPERISNVISHFSPVEHVYSAIGNVIIDREIPIQKNKIERQPFSTPILNIFPDEQEIDLEPVLSETVVPPPENNRRSKRNAGKNVEVHLTEHRISHVDHFNPRAHHYDAKENVDFSNVKKTPTPISTVRKPEKKYKVEKHVQVHLKEHRTSHIDHFNPRAHHYNAKEDVYISQGRSDRKPVKPKSPSVTVRKTFVRPQKLPATYRRPEKKIKIQKHVEVHLDEHRISHIDHFNPRGHHYDAEEDVSINQGGNRIHLQPKRPESRFKVEKHVEVHLPEHRISHIDHFNPRQHHYDAIEDVFISQDEQTVNQVPLRPQKPLVTVRKPFLRPSKPPPVVRFEAKPPQSNLNVQKHVEVHLEEHRTSHIDHFNPRSHHYDAEEDVFINQGGKKVNTVLIKPKTPTVSVRRPVLKQPETPVVIPHSEKTDVKFDGFDFGILTPEISTIDGYSLPTFSISVKDSGTDTENFSTFDIDSTSSVDNKYDINSYIPPSTEKPTVVTNKPIVVTKKPRPPVPTIPPKRKRPHIKKHVQVHLKQHRISPYDHFNPVSHSYDAEENFSIN